MDIHEIIRHYTEQIDSGKIEFSQLRNELNKNHLLEKDETNTVVRLVDKKVQEIALLKSEKSKGRNELLLGIFAFSIGLLITLGTFSGFFGSGNFYIATIGLLGYGAFSMFNGRRKTKA